MAVSGRKKRFDIPSTDLIGSDEDLDVFCQPCDRDGSRVSSFGFCTNCKEHLCQTCFNHHKKATLSRHHVLLNKDELAKSQLQRLSTFHDDTHEDFTKPCPKHTKELIRFFCHRHSLLICSICMLEHRNCCINYIPEISGNPVDGNEFNTITANISTLVDDSQMVLEQAEKNAELSKHSLAKSATEIKKLTETIRKKTDEIENNIEMLETNMHEETGNMLANTDEKCGTVIRTLKEILQRLWQLNTLKEPNKLFVELKEAVPQMQHCKDKVIEAAENIDSTKLLFHPNENLMALLESDISFGEIEIVKRKTNIKGKCIEVVPEIAQTAQTAQGVSLDLRADDVQLLQPIGKCIEVWPNISLDLRADDIELLQPIGSEKQNMRRGMFRLVSGEKMPVAVRTMEKESAEEVLNEAKLLLKISQKHIIKMIGLCKSDNVMLVMELAPLGSLRLYLLDHKDTTQWHIVELLWQVATAMEYLEKNRIVHRNLAARNVLLVSEHYAKVTDFSMAVEIKDDEEFYEAQEAGRWPLKWYAPDCIYFWQFDTKSDVWSYGVTMWESMSFGEKPYNKMKAHEVLHFLVDDGQRLSKPEHCKEDVYNLMLQCWEYDKTERPTFQEIATEMYASFRRK